MGTPIHTLENRANAAFANNPTTQEAPTQLVEAQGWVIGDNSGIMRYGYSCHCYNLDSKAYYC